MIETGKYSKPPCPDHPTPTVVSSLLFWSIYPTDPLHFFFLEYSENLRVVIALIDGGGEILSDHYF